ncbi:MAG: anthranilate synthase component I family protein [Planctomycetota bacterium]
MRPFRQSSAADETRTGLAWAVYPADRTTPVGAFERLRAAGERCALLESVEGPAHLARHSFLTVGVDGALRAGPGFATLRLGPEGAPVELACGPLDAVRHASLTSRQGAGAGSETHPDLPPFTGGWVGSVAYELAHSLEPTVLPFAPEREPGAHDVVLDHASDVVAFDHAAQTLTVVAATRGPDGENRDARARIEEIAAGLAGASATDTAAFRLTDDAARGLTDPAAFLAGVERLQAEIRRGEIFQAVLSQAFERTFEGDPFTLYRVLRLVNPAPHMFFFESDDLTLVGSSPERLVSVQGRAIELVPIGTRPRGATTDEDVALGVELGRDEKELAEHDMLVDLARNDAGRVARVGTVRVTEHRRLRRFPRVQHLVSRVRAELAAGRDAVDALGAAFPAGTVSGTPKVRAMQLIAEAEGRPRGAYGGAFGYVDRTGDLDLALCIRTLVCRGSTLRIQAGAGVVHDSEPEKERLETLAKARALFEAIELATSPAFGAPDDPGTVQPNPTAKPAEAIR